MGTYVLTDISRKWIGTCVLTDICQKWMGTVVFLMTSVENGWVLAYLPTSVKRDRYLCTVENDQHARYIDVVRRLLFLSFPLHLGHRGSTSL